MLSLKYPSNMAAPQSDALKRDTANKGAPVTFAIMSPDANNQKLGEQRLRATRNSILEPADKRRQAVGKDARRKLDEGSEKGVQGMKLKMHSCDFEENTITFVIPEKTMKEMGFYPCELEVGIEELFINKMSLEKLRAEGKKA